MSGARVRVALPHHLRGLAGVEDGALVELELPDGAVTIRGVMDALEARHPTLRGTIRDHDTGARRAYMRYFAGREDVSLDPPDAALPDGVARGRDVFRVLGAIAGG